VLGSRLANPPASPTGRIVRCGRHPRRKDASLDEIKNIAVPITRRATSKKARRAGRPQSAPDQVVGGAIGLPRPAARALRPLDHHRYHIGQRLRVLGGGNHWSRLGGYCKVLALMPHEGGPFLYRIRSEIESFERVVAEADLVADAD
jgi:hypothetical protein